MGFPILPVAGSQLILGGYARLRRDPIKYVCPSGYKPEVDVVIPAYRAAKRIPYALATLAEQSYANIGRITVVDDGSNDRTSEVAKLFGEALGLDLEIIRREKSQGKTPSIKQVARSGNSDKLFVFDEDTLLEPDYIEKVRVPHYNDKVASSFGIVRPLTRMSKSTFYKHRIEPLVNRLHRSGIQDPEALLGGLDEKKGFAEDLKYYSTKWPVEKYRQGLYATDQYFARDSQLRIFGTTLFPIGCGVMYDREELKTVFDDFEKTLGDNLSSSEDIFVGFAFCNKGLINAQVKDTSMITTEPYIKRLPYQATLWGSSFIQCAYYFGDMTIGFRKKNLGFAALPQSKGKQARNDRAISQSVNEENQFRYRQPLGWIILPPLVEKMSFPIILAYMAYFLPDWAISLIVTEFIFFALSTYASVPENRREGLTSSILVSEFVRLPSLFLDIYMMGKFAHDIVRGKRDWKK